MIENSSLVWESHTKTTLRRVPACPASMRGTKSSSMASRGTACRQHVQQLRLRGMLHVCGMASEGQQGAPWHGLKTLRAAAQQIWGPAAKHQQQACRHDVQQISFTCMAPGPLG